MAGESSQRLLSDESSRAGEGESQGDAEPPRQHAPMDAAPELFDPTDAGR